MFPLDEGRNKIKQSKAKNQKRRQKKCKLGEACLLPLISFPTMRLSSGLQDIWKTGPHVFKNVSHSLRLSSHHSILQNRLKNFFCLKVCFLSCCSSSDAYDIPIYLLKYPGELVFYHL